MVVQVVKKQKDSSYLLLMVFEDETKEEVILDVI